MLKRSWDRVFEIFKKQKKGGKCWGSDSSSHKNGEVGKIGGVVFMLTKPSQCYISLSVWCVCMCVCLCVCFLFIYTISI